MDPADPSLPDETLTVQEFIHEFEAAEEVRSSNSVLLINLTLVFPVFSGG